jgi:hypothetical protein
MKRHEFRIASQCDGVSLSVSVPDSGLSRTQSDGITDWPKQSERFIQREYRTSKQRLIGEWMIVVMHDTSFLVKPSAASHTGEGCSGSPLSAVPCGLCSSFFHIPSLSSQSLCTILKAQLSGTELPHGSINIRLRISWIQKHLRSSCVALTIHGVSWED